MAKFRVIHDRPVCIGCGACVAICSVYWEMAGDGKSHLKGTPSGGPFTLDLDNISCNLDAAKACPVNCIHIENEGKKLI